MEVANLVPMQMSSWKGRMAAIQSILGIKSKGCERKV